MGYTTIKDAKDLYWGNTKITQRMRIPQTPAMQVSAGAKDLPIPERAPENTSRNTLMAKRPTTTCIRIVPISMISALEVNTESMGRAKMQQSALSTIVEEQPNRSDQRTERRQRSMFLAPKFWPTNVMQACVQDILKQSLAKAPDREAVVIADKEAETGVLVQVIDMCNLAGVKKVSIAAQAE